MNGEVMKEIEDREGIHSLRYPIPRKSSQYANAFDQEGILIKCETLYIPYTLYSSKQTHFWAKIGIPDILGIHSILTP